MKPVQAIYALLMPLILLISGCAGCNEKPKTNWQLNLRKESKDPYGLYLAYQSLPHLFPGTVTEDLKSSYRLTNLGYQLRKNKGKSLVVLIGLGLHFNEGEMDSLVAYIEDGHQVMLIANHFEDSLMSRLHLVPSFHNESFNQNSQKIFLKGKNNQQQAFPYQYKEHSVYPYFEYQDAARYSYEIGTTGSNKPDCIVYSIGKGKLFLHASPIAFTNYFLLQGQNNTYLHTLFSYVSEPVSHIYWSSFNYRDVTNSDWGVIWKNRATRYALLLAIFALGIYLLFEMKRRQKIIPIIPPVENSSVAFVETIGRLYYNKKNHSNLAEKMVHHFLDFVRSNYYLNTNVLDEEFIKHLAAKSGQPLGKADSLVRHIKEVQNGITADEAFLYALYTQIQDFYNGK